MSARPFRETAFFLSNPKHSSLGHIFLKVSTGYDGEQTAPVLERMNNLAHFAADVLGDKYKIFDVIPFRMSPPCSM